VDAVSGAIHAHTPIADMKALVLQLYEHYRVHLEAPFFRQETRYSCAPACLRVVLGAFVVHMDKAQLRHLTDCSPLGTDAFQLIEAVGQLGFLATRKYTLASIEELGLVVREGGFPIVYGHVAPAGQAVDMISLHSYLASSDQYPSAVKMVHCRSRKTVLTISHQGRLC
jgi:hypothetical protein